jgi:hypothetical protein
MEMMESRFKGCLLGLTCGDAVGTTLEFQPRGSFEPVTDMVGGVPFGLRAGTGTMTRPWPCAWPSACWRSRGLTRETRWSATSAGGPKGT